MDSPLKLPQLTDPELKAVQNAAQLACYHCVDLAASRAAVTKSVNEAFQVSLEAIEKKSRQLKASEKKVEFLQEEVGKFKKELMECKGKLELLEGCSAFYADEKKDAVTQTEEETGKQEEENMSWADDS